jgi:hypothetical protein
MVFTPEQYRHIAETYDSIAADHSLPPAQREGFARKADWYRMLARLGAKPKWAMLANKAEKQPHADASFLSAAARGLFAWQKRR